MKTFSETYKLSLESLNKLKEESSKILSESHLDFYWDSDLYSNLFSNFDSSFYPLSSPNNDRILSLLKQAPTHSSLHSHECTSDAKLFVSSEDCTEVCSDLRNSLRRLGWSEISYSDSEIGQECIFTNIFDALALKVMNLSQIGQSGTCVAAFRFHSNPSWEVRMNLQKLMKQHNLSKTALLSILNTL